MGVAHGVSLRLCILKREECVGGCDGAGWGKGARADAEGGDFS